MWLNSNLISTEWLEVHVHRLKSFIKMGKNIPGYQKSWQCNPVVLWGLTVRVLLCSNSLLYKMHFATLSGDIRLKLCLDRLNEVAMLNIWNASFFQHCHTNFPPGFDMDKQSYFFYFPTALISLRSNIQLNATASLCAGSLRQMVDCLGKCIKCDHEHLTWPLWCHLCWPAYPPYIPSWRRRPGWSLRTPPGEHKEETHLEIRCYILQQPIRSNVCTVTDLSDSCRLMWLGRALQYSDA